MRTQQTKNQHGAKAVYDYVQTEKTSILNTVNSKITTANSSTDTKIATAKSELSKEIDTDVAALKSEVNTSLATKLDTAKIKVLTGDTLGINPGESKVANIPYPSGFTQANTIILGKMVSSANNYYDSPSQIETQNGFVNISMIALTADYVKVWFKNIDADEALIGHYKITLLRVD
jgi:hypothetical protein